MNVKDRLYALMTYYGKSKTEFAEHIGTTLQILNVYYTRSTLSKTLRDKILTQFPEVSPEWLATGEGVMLLDNKAVKREDPTFLVKENIERVNLYNPGLQCDSYIKVSGFACEPAIVNGDTIGIRQQSIDSIDPAKYYLIVTEDGTPIIKRIVGVDAENILMTADTLIQPFPLAKSKVKGLYRIVYLGRNM